MTTSRSTTRFLWQAGFWLLVTVIFVYDRKYLLQKINLEHFIPCIVVRIGLLMGLAYWNLYVLVPRFWHSRRYGVYALLLSCSVLISLVIQGLYDTYLYGFVIGDEDHQHLLPNLPFNLLATSWYLVITLLLKLALDQLDNQQNQSLHQQVIREESPVNHVWLKSGTRRINVALTDILYVQGLKDYSLVYTQTERHIVQGSLKIVEEMLPADQFIRVHKSFLVARGHIRALRSDQVELSNQQIPIGRVYRKDVEKLMGQPGNAYF